MTANRLLQNTKWIIFCKILQALTQLVIGMISARYLGPDHYGLISYAASLTAFAIPVMQLGFRSTLVQEYVENPQQEGQILGTGLALNLLSALACITGLAAFAMIAHRNEPETLAVCILYSIRLLFQGLEMVQYWFHVRLKAKYPSLAALGAYILVSLYKIYLLATRKNILWFAISHSIEYALLGILLLVIYRKIGGGKLCFSSATARRMLSRSKYYILSGLMVTVFQNTDHIMLKILVGEGENGFYTAAITCAGVAGFLYHALIDSFRPVILAERRKSPEQFGRMLSRLYSLIFYLSLAQSIGFALLADPIVTILYGRAYSPAIPVLQILVWYIAFSHMGILRNIWILAEGKQNLLWIINLSGALLNIGLNSWMIPLWGARGAALASVITQLVSNFILGFIWKPLRPNNRLLIAGFHPQLALEALAQLCR